MKFIIWQVPDTFLSALRILTAIDSQIGPYTFRWSHGRTSQTEVDFDLKCSL